ncbi:MAG TPA: hypothetical protein VK809_06300 [Bacteroidia bacterium]|jgi:hypothetical protein|nr:hypothetical protein [Bacteroidia bacterium]
MKTTKNHDAVQAWIKANPNMTFDSIKAGNPKMSDVLLKGVIKELEKEGIITANGEDGGYVFAEKEEKKGSKKDTASADTKASKKNDDDLGPKTYTGRDNSKYRFGENRNLPKGRLVIALLKTYIESNSKVSLAKLQELFHSEELQPRYGVVLELSAAKKFSKNKVDRHFVKNPDDILKLGNGTKVAVCNQWTKDGIDKLIKIVSAQPFGYKVKIETAE